MFYVIRLICVVENFSFICSACWCSCRPSVTNTAHCEYCCSCLSWRKGDVTEPFFGMASANFSAFLPRNQENSIYHSILLYRFRIVVEQGGFSVPLQSTVNYVRWSIDSDSSSPQSHLVYLPLGKNLRNVHFGLRGIMRDSLLSFKRRDFSWKQNPKKKSSHTCAGKDTSPTIENPILWIEVGDAQFPLIDFRDINRPHHRLFFQ